MMEKDISLRVDRGRFKYRVAGVVIFENKILLVKEDRWDFWYLPGGHAKIFESSTVAIKREIEEELGQKPILDRLLWTTECMYYFSDENAHHHDLTFYYLMHFPKNSELYLQEHGMGKEEFSNEKTILRYQWFKLDCIDDLYLIPDSLKIMLKNLPEKTEHLIFDDLSMDGRVALVEKR